MAEDKHSIQRFIHASLSGQVMLLEAATGEEALAITRPGRPDVIRLDQGLPDKNKLEGIRRLRKWT